MVLESRTRVGQLGEDLAVAHMETWGHHILARNWRWRRFEIDVISAHAGQVIFHEVKCRTGCVVPRWSDPPQLPSQGQQQRIVRAAHAYLRGEGQSRSDCRFDLWWVRIHPGRPPRLTHLPNAFDGVAMPSRKRNPWRSLR